MSTATLMELWPGVEAAGPTNSDPLLVAAGWCEENEMPELAYALMWAAGKGRRPFKRTDVQRQPWLWYMDTPYVARTLGRNKTRERKHAFVSPVIAQLADGVVPSQTATFPTSRAAYLWLGRGLAALRELVEVPTIVRPPQPTILAGGPLTCKACGIMRDRSVLDCPVCRSGETK